MYRTIVFIIFSANLFAFYSGNPSDPAIIQKGLFFCEGNPVSVQVGYLRDQLYNQKQCSSSGTSFSTDNFSYISDQGTLDINFLNRVSVFTKIGSAAFNVTLRPESTSMYSIITSNQLAYSIGFQGILSYWKGLTLGVNGGFFHANPHILYITGNGVPLYQPGDSVATNQSSLTYKQWQVALAASYQVSIFYPYIGLKYLTSSSYFKNLPGNFYNTVNNLKTKNKRKFGIVLGTTFTNGQNFDLTVESRIIDEQSLSIKGSIEF